MASTDTAERVPTARKRAHAGFRRLAWADYFKHPALSRSTLDKIRKSPAHLQHYLAHGTEETSAMIEGRVFHSCVEAAVTGRAAVLAERVAVWTGDRRSGKAWDEFQQQHVGRDIVRVDDMARIELMAAAVLRHPIARRAMEGSTIEAAAVWKDEATGIDCKALIDVVTDGQVLYDLKTTADIDHDAFVRAAFNFGYHRQGAWYLDGATAVTGRPYTHFGFIIVEKEAPYTVRVLGADDDFIMRGRAENRANLNLFTACKLSNSWPGPGAGDFETLSLPRWAE